MASFPDAVKTFTTKNPSDVIQSAHINDLQDEVNAIEAGVINGTAPINSSRATPAALSVAGGSTLATLSVSGASTFGVRPVAPPPHGARVFLASTVTLGSSAESTISWTAQDYLTNSSMHSTTTNPTQLIPQSTGLYAVSAQASFSVNSTGWRQMILQDSSGGFLGRALGYPSQPSSDIGVTLQAHGTKRFDALGGFVVCRLLMTGASTLSLSSGDCWASMHKL